MEQEPPVRRCLPPAGDLSTLRDIVDEYIRRKQLPAALELQFYAGQPTLADAIDVAALCKAPNGKRHPHQNRIPPASLAEARLRLLAADLGTAATFDELHDAVAALIGDLWMVADLTIYDIAHRIGAHLGLAPERVYLHRGTRVGARALGLGRGRATLELRDLPPEFHRLTAAEAEDCLCIYKDRLREVDAT
ncbi:MAG: hypothetical protein IPK26_11010 [Planctomycetes bacterium]|nr:hypothetical protein [Planctomycetota bacterium]